MAPTSGSSSSTRPSRGCGRLEEDWLAGEPSLDEVLERLRERRRIPEHADFRAFKRQQLAMFTSLIEPQKRADAPAGRAHAAAVGLAASASAA